MATANPLPAIVPVNVRSNDAECSELVVQCEREWNVERVKQEIERKHPKHYPTHSQVIYYCGHRVSDSELLVNLFQTEHNQLPNINPQHTLWLGVVMENKVFQEFLSLPKPDTAYPEPDYPYMDSTHPYFSALKYYNYLTSAQSQMKSTFQDVNTTSPQKTEIAEAEAAPAARETEVNPEGAHAEQAGEGNPEQDGDDFNFLGGRLDRAQGIGAEEVQEQNAIINAITLLVRLSLFLYITYHFAPQYKFYLVIGFSVIMFIYQLGLFRINRVNIRRYQVVEEEVRGRGRNNENNPEQNTDVNPGETTPSGSVPTATELPPNTDGTVGENAEISIAGPEVHDNTPIPVTNPGNSMVGVLKSVITLLYNLFLSFNPEFNVQEVQ